MCVCRSFIECWLPLLLTTPPLLPSPLDQLFGAVARAKLARRVALALNYFAPSAAEPAPATPPGKALPPRITLDVVYASLCCWLKSNGVISDPSWGLGGRGTRNEIEKIEIK